MKEDVEIGDQHAMEGPDQRADQKAEQHGQHPDHGMAEAEIIRQEPDLEDAHQHGGDAEHRADRKIDVPGHDDQNHAGRHHRDGGGLHRQVPEVSVGQECAIAVIDLAVGFEAHPDEDERAEHAEHACIDFRRTQEGPNGGLLDQARPGAALCDLFHGLFSSCPCRSRKACAPDQASPAFPVSHRGNQTAAEVPLREASRSCLPLSRTGASARAYGRSSRLEKTAPQGAARSQICQRSAEGRLTCKPVPRWHRRRRRVSPCRSSLHPELRSGGPW